MEIGIFSIFGIFLQTILLILLLLWNIMLLDNHNFLPGWFLAIGLHLTPVWWKMLVRVQTLSKDLFMCYILVGINSTNKVVEYFHKDIMNNIVMNFSDIFC